MSAPSGVPAGHGEAGPANSLGGRHRARAARAATAVLLLVNGWIHLALYLDWAKYNDVVGPLFLVNAFAAVVIAGLLFLRHGTLELVLAAGFGAATLGAFVLSAVLPGGFFGIREPWGGTPQIVSAVTDVLIVAGAVWVYVRERRA